MPQVETREGSRGTAYCVRFRHEGRGTSRTFGVKRHAESFARDLERMGVLRTLDKWDGTPEPEVEPEPEAPPELTLDEWAERHFDTITGTTSGTLVTYRRTYAREWSPHLGRLPLSAVDRSSVGAIINSMIASDKTIKNRHGILSTLMKAAVREGLIVRNPCEGMKLPRNTEHLKRLHRFLTVAEYHHLMSHVAVHYRPLVATLAGTGMRWGEVSALRVMDVNRDAMNIRVNKAIKWSPTQNTRAAGPTKTKRSNRVVDIDADLLDMLAPLVVGRRGDDLLFSKPCGTQLDNAAFSRQVWTPAVARAELHPRPWIHDLRHTHVAWLIDAGVSLPVIQARLGHESITTTIDVYGHLYPSGQRAAADAIQRMLRSHVSVETVVPLAIAR